MPSDSIICVVYVSHTAQLMSEAELEEILATSRRNNAATGVTGQLIYASGNFIQAIEGPEGAVASLLKRLTADPRHRGVTTIARWRIEQRAFPDWTMAFRRVPEAEAEVVADLLPSIAPLAAADHPTDSMAKRLLAAFRRGNRP